MMDISVVVPLFNEDESIPELINWIERVMEDHNFSYEIVMVDDGSMDNSWEVIQQNSIRNNRIKGISFQRNYGKSAALHVAFQHVHGNVVITMDADLQDSPDEIPELYKMIVEDDFDIVSGWKKKRKDPVLTKNLPSKLYNFTVRKMSGIKLHDMNCGLKAYNKKVVKSIEVYGEMHRFIPVLAKWAGFKKIGEKVVHHQERKFGVTKFGLERFVRGPLDLISVMFISRFSKRPMHFFGVWGFLMFLIGFLAAVFVGIQKLYGIHNGIQVRLVTENPYFFIALTAMIIGTLLFMTGFIGDMVSRSSSDRNKYIIGEKTQTIE